MTIGSQASCVLSPHWQCQRRRLTTCLHLSASFCYGPRHYASSAGSELPSASIYISGTALRHLFNGAYIVSQAITRFSSTLPFPFSRAVQAGGFLFLSGQVSMSEQAEPMRSDITTQTHNIMAAIERTLQSCGSSLNAVVKVTVWLSDMKHFAEFNQAYAAYFPAGFPARSVVCAKLAFELDVEIEVQALA